MSAEANLIQCRLTGAQFKICINVLIENFNVSIPYINGVGFELTYNNKKGKSITTEFNYGHHFLSYLNDQSIVCFYVRYSEWFSSLSEKSGLGKQFIIIILLAEHLNIYAHKKDQKLSDPINEEQLDKLKEEGVELLFNGEEKIHPDDIFLYAKEKQYTSSSEEELNENQKAFLGEITDESDYINYIRQEMLELYLFVNDWKKPTDQPLTLKCGAKTIKLNNHSNWTFKALNEYLNKYIDINSVEEAQDDLAFNYSKKIGRKANNKFQTLMIYGIDNIYQTATDSEEITNQQCEFIRDYLKHLGLPITQDSFDHDDDIKNIRSRIRYLRKNGCSETWGLPSSYIETTKKFHSLQTRRK